MKVDITDKLPDLYQLERIFNFDRNKFQLKLLVAVGPKKIKAEVYQEDKAKHNEPHVHFNSPEHSLVINLKTDEVIKGSIKGPARRNAIIFYKTIKTDVIRIWNDLNPNCLV